MSKPVIFKKNSARQVRYCQMLYLNWKIVLLNRPISKLGFVYFWVLLIHFFPCTDISYQRSAEYMMLPIKFILFVLEF